MRVIVKIWPLYRQYCFHVLLYNILVLPFLAAYILSHLMQIKGKGVEESNYNAGFCTNKVRVLGSDEHKYLKIQIFE